MLFYGSRVRAANFWGEWASQQPWTGHSATRAARLANWSAVPKYKALLGLPPPFSVLGSIRPFGHWGFGDGQMIGQGHDPGGSRCFIACCPLPKGLQLAALRNSVNRGAPFGNA